MNQLSVFDDRIFAFCLLLPTFLLFPDIPLWAFATALTFWFYRLVLDRAGWRIPSRFVTGLFSTLFLSICYLNYKTLVGREVSSTFLVIILALKTLEYRDLKERGFLTLLSLYLLIAKFLFDTQLIWFSIGFPAIITLLYYLLPSSFRHHQKKSAGLFLIRSLLLASPLAGFLFFYFPRVTPESLNLIADSSRQGRIGFSAEVEPGSVSSLSQNNDVAFRAEFKNLQASPNSLYWRGLTLTLADGMKWRLDGTQDSTNVVYAIIPENVPQVTITLEPNEGSWLFTLENTTAVASDQITILSGPLGTYKSQGFFENRILYSLKVQQGPTRERTASEKLIVVKPTTDPETLQLLAELSKGTKGPRNLVERISDFYIKEQFRYTLSPQDDGTLSLHDFLFKSKKGFCEHFASATALLLNNLGIPTRVVIGYQGGEYNPIGRFWTIRQRDAHAWVEYLDENNLWHRYDPTAAVSPLRLSLGALPHQQVEQENLTIEKINELQYGQRQQAWFESINFYIENLNHQWNHFFVNFSLEKQKDLLEQLDINPGSAILSGMLLTLILSLSLSWLLRTRQKLPRSLRIYNLMNETFKQYDLQNKKAEGLMEWRKRLINAFPKKQNFIETIFECYIAEAYANRPSKENWKRAKRAVKAIS